MRSPWDTGQDIKQKNVSKASAHDMIFNMSALRFFMVWLALNSFLKSQTIVNGDFEAGYVGFNNSLYPSTADLSAGSHGSLVGTSQNYDTTNLVAGSDHTTGTGNMFVYGGAGFLDTSNGLGPWLQNVNLIAGQTYEFSFFHYDWGVQPTSTFRLYAMYQDPELPPFDDYPSEYFVESYNRNGDNTWQEFTSQFTVATSGVHTLVIAHDMPVGPLGSGAGGVWAIDDISLSPVVPEPHVVSYTFLILLALSFNRRRYTN